MATTQQAIPHTWPKIKKIAVLTDFSKNADTALRFAAAFARGYKADIVLAHAYMPPSCAYSAPKVKLVYQTLDASRKRWADQLLSKTEATYLKDIKCSALLHEGLPNELLERARGRGPDCCRNLGRDRDLQKRPWDRRQRPSFAPPQFLC